MGRQKKEINWDLVELYLKSGCSQKKICESLDICKDTLCDKIKEKYDMNFSSFSSSLRSEGELLLEAALFQKALKSSSPGNTQMLIWLSKVKLGYKEPETETQNKSNITINVNGQLGSGIKVSSSTVSDTVNTCSE